MDAEEELSDETLELQHDVRELAAGEARAFSRLYNRLQSRALHTATRILRDAAEAEDAVHDAFIEVWRRAAEYTADKASVVTWVMMIVHSRATDRSRRRRTRVESQRAAAMHNVISGGTDPATHIESRKLEEAIAALPEHQREVLTLALGQGLSNAEVGEVLKIPIGTVKSRISRALQELRAQDQDSTDEGP